ncbi:hypothetical protein BV898_13548 [Hypsibius exemplaris]|uniref:Uncharacterized protein n=1 Tax=Hypsibius exemplaris TaxID=2072580 RepID=A0A1W0WAF5_HYPEX|nr:hypothetical protein BV898_13548 [Hypsibius exemplaris]
MWIENVERQFDLLQPDHLWIRRDVALDSILALSGLASFICILTAFAGNFIDDENVFHAVVMFSVCAVETMAVLLTICDFWARYLPHPDDVHFVRLLHGAVGFIFSLLSSTLMTAFYVKRWEPRCELNRGRGNIQKCDCLVASSVLGFAITAIFLIKCIAAVWQLKNLR